MIFSIILVLIVGTINSDNLISEKKIEVTNINRTKNGKALIKKLEFETHETYNSALPKGTVQAHYLVGQNRETIITYILMESIIMMNNMER